MTLKLTKQGQLNQDTLTKILREHFGDDSLRLSDIADNLVFLKENDNFNSEVKKWTFKVIRGDKGKSSIFTYDNAVYCILKKPLLDSQVKRVKKLCR
jgi:hypothetical protein